MVNNGKIERFEDILIWQESRVLVKDVYAIFSKCRDFSFRDQIQRAVISIMNNVAEGYERKGDKEFKRFLYIAKGSCGEVRSMLYIALDLGYIRNQDFENLYKKAEKISKMLASFIKKLNF
jgi:four helix bundle protein